MEKKIKLIGISIILSVLFLMQASVVYAGGSESIYFYSDFGDFVIDDSQTIYKDGLPWITQLWLSGDMYTIDGFFPVPFGTFTAIETREYNYDKNGDLRWWVSNQECIITTTGGDTFTINAKFKWEYGVPLDFQRPGSWRIVDGTGLLVGVNGKGQYLPPFEYFGTIR